MKAEYINPFLKSLKRTFDTMLNCKVKRETLRLKEGNTASFPISGIVGLSGNAVGTVVLSLSNQVAMKAAETMLMTEVKEVDDSVIDAVGELANMIAGAAKAELEKYNMKISLPSVITGENHQIRFPSNVSPVSVPFTTDFGPIVLEVGLAPVAEPVGA